MARRFRYAVLDVFADRPFAGNPLCVFPEAEGLSGEEMQRLARETNLSETTFVLPPTDPAKAAVRVRIFTPSEELPYAGHPSVGTHWLLAQEGRHRLTPPRTRLVQEVGAGLLPIDVVGRGEAVFSTQARPVFSDPLDPRELAEALGLGAADVGLAGLPPQVVSTGIPWLLVPVRDHAALARARPAPDARDRLLKLYGRNRVYPFTLGGFEPDALTAARGLLPGEFEDPVTGSATGCLGAYLARHGRLTPGPDGVARFVHTQGHGMGRPGRVQVEVRVESGEPVEVRIGGSCVRMMEGHALLP
jgi:trans-2,3-dihydro-3-hydroxyanthranilate isomerase